MSQKPMPSRRALAELATTGYADDRKTKHTGSPVRLAVVMLTALLDAQVTELAEINRIEADIFDWFGHPRVALPVRLRRRPSDAADISTIRHHLGSGRGGRRLSGHLRRRQHRFADAAAAVGLPTAEVRASELDARIRGTTATLLLALVSGTADLAWKLAVMTAASEPEPPKRTAFPATHPRVLLSISTNFDSS